MTEQEGCSPAGRNQANKVVTAERADDVRKRLRAKFNASASASIEKTRDAVRDFGRAQFESLTRRAIYRLQCQPASGIYGDDYNFKSMWDEYYHDVQNGPFGLLEDAWEDFVSGTIVGLVESLPRESAVLPTICAVDELFEDDGGDVIGSVWQDGLVRVLRDKLASEAGNRSIEHLAGW